jgi:hypothetical protein
MSDSDRRWCMDGRRGCVVQPDRQQTHHTGATPGMRIKIGLMGGHSHLTCEQQYGQEPVSHVPMHAFRLTGQRIGCQ